MTQNKEANPFPEINLFRPIEIAKNLAHLVFDHLQHPTPSEHFTAPLDDTFDLALEHELGHAVAEGDMTAFEAYCKLNNHLPPAA